MLMMRRISACKGQEVWDQGSGTLLHKGEPGNEAGESLYENKARISPGIKTSQIPFQCQIVATE